MNDPLKPDMTLLSVLGSIVIHFDEATSPGAHPFDIETARQQLASEEVQEWIRAMGALLPAKRQPKGTK